MPDHKDLQNNELIKNDCSFKKLVNIEEEGAYYTIFLYELMTEDKFNNDASNQVLNTDFANKDERLSYNVDPVSNTRRNLKIEVGPSIH